MVLAEAEKERFHMTVAHLLYLSKHVRPDILMAIGFLCLHMKEQTYEDQQKLLLLLGYLQAMASRKLIMHLEGILKV